MFCSSQKGFLIARAFQLEGARPLGSSHLSIGREANVTLFILYTYCLVSWLCLCYYLFGLYTGLESSSSDGVLTSSTEPFCGRFSLGQLRHLILYPSADKNGYQLDQYPYVSIYPHVSGLGRLGGDDVVFWV